MRSFLASTAFIFSAFSFGLIAFALVCKVLKFGDFWLAIRYTFGAWPDIHWLDVAIAAALVVLGTGCLYAGLLLTSRRQ